MSSLQMTGLRLDYDLTGNLFAVAPSILRLAVLDTPRDAIRYTDMARFNGQTAQFGLPKIDLFAPDILLASIDDMLVSLDGRENHSRTDIYFGELGPVDNHLEAMSAATRFQHAA